MEGNEEGDADGAMDVSQSEPGQAHVDELEHAKRAALISYLVSIGCEDCLPDKDTVHIWKKARLGGRSRTAEDNGTVQYDWSFTWTGGVTSCR